MEHVTPKRTYVVVCGSLLGLTLLTYLASFVNLGPLHTPVGLGIAAVKAALIALFFMNARFGSGITRIVIVGGLVWLGILLIGTMDDYITRGWLGIPGK